MTTVKAPLPETDTLLVFLDFIYAFVIADFLKQLFDTLLLNEMANNSWQHILNCLVVEKRALPLLFSVMIFYFVVTDWITARLLTKRCPYQSYVRFFFDLLIAACSSAALIVKFAVATGMRLGEICALRKASYQTDEAGNAFVITERTKNGDRLVWPLEGWPLKYVKQRVASAAFPGDFLFPGPGGGNAYTSVHHTLPDVVRKAGLKFGRKDLDGVTFHTFRHSMASLALNHGVPESVVQRMGNWKTRVMVDRYAHLADESLRAGAATLAKLLSSRTKKAATQKKPPAYETRTLASKGSDLAYNAVVKRPAISTI